MPTSKIAPVSNKIKAQALLESLVFTAAFTLVLWGVFHVMALALLNSMLRTELFLKCRASLYHEKSLQAESFWMPKFEIQNAIEGFKCRSQIQKPEMFKRAMQIQLIPNL